MSTNPPRTDDDEEGDDRPGPQDLIPSERLEQGIIAFCLIADRMPSDVPFLQPEHFYTETDRAAWQGLIELEALGCRGDVETLANHLERTARVKDVEWHVYCMRVATDPVQRSLFNFEQDARDVYDRALRRQRIRELEQQAGELARQARDLLDLSVPLPESGLETTPDDVHSAAEAFEDLPPVDWLVKDILAPGSVVLLYGKPGTKKTYSMMFLQACLAVGRDWLGFKTRQAPSLLVDQESGHPRIQQRTHECLNGVGGGKTAPIYWETMKGYKLSNPAHIAKIIEHFKKHHIQVGIADSLSKHSTGDENSAGDMAKDMEGLREVATKTNAAMLAIHHSKKLEDKVRGSSAIEGSVDVIIHVESEPGSPFIHFTMEKNRDGELLEWWAQADWFQDENAPRNNRFTMKRVEGKRDEQGEKLSPLRQWILDTLKDKGETGLPDIVQAAADIYSEIGVRKAVKALEQEGRIRRTGTKVDGSKKNTIFFELAPSEEE